MILNNYTKLLWSNLCNTTATAANIPLISGDTLTHSTTPTFSGDIVISNYAGGNTTTATTTINTGVTYGYVSLTFGSGTTEPTADDYQMESPYDTTNHFSWQSQTQSYVAANLTKVITASIANISEEDLTVSEIGVVLFSVSSSIAYNNILIARSLITPVTIAPNETKTFQYTLDFTGIAG